MSMSVTVWADRAQKATQSDAFDLFDLGIGCLDSYWQTSKHLSFWTGKKSPKKIQQTLRWTTTAWVRGASIKVPFSLCTWRRTILPSVGVQLLPWRVSWWRCVGWWIFSNDFCACFLFFCFHSFKKGCVSLQTTWAFHPRLAKKCRCFISRNGKVAALGRWWRQFFSNRWMSRNVQKLCRPVDVNVILSVMSRSC